LNQPVRSRRTGISLLLTFVLFFGHGDLLFAAQYSAFAPTIGITVAKLTDKEKSRIVQRMCEFVPHARLLGLRLEQVDGEEVTMRLPYRAELVGNPETGTLHGGVLTVLLDQTLGTASLCCDQVGTTITPTLDLRIDHLGIAPAGKDILAVARVYKVTRRILFVEGFAYWDSREKPIARATGSWVLMPELNLGELMQPVLAGAQQQ